MNQARVEHQAQCVRPRRLIPVPSAPPSKSDVDLARLVVVEEGVQHFESQLPRNDSDHTVVVAQVPGESYPLLAQRVRKARASLARGGKRVGPAIWLLSAHHDAGTLRSRLLLGKAMLDAMPNTTPGAELTLIATDCAQELRLELMSIVETLVVELGSGQPPMRLRFPAPATAQSRPAPP